MKTICAHFLFLSFLLSAFFTCSLSFLFGALCDLEDITWMKGNCPIQEMSREVSRFEEIFLALQRECGILCMDRLERVRLIDQNFSSTSEDELLNIRRICCRGTLPSPILYFLMVGIYGSLW